MNVDLKFNSKELDAKLKKMVQQMPEKVDKALLQTSFEGINMIQKAARSGYGYKGRFAPYTPEYRKRKAEGWNPTQKTRGFGGAGSIKRPNLILRGEMFGAMSATLKSHGVAKIYFTRATEAKKAAFNNQSRPFMGFSSDGKNKLRSFFYKRFKV